MFSSRLSLDVSVSGVVFSDSFKESWSVLVPHCNVLRSGPVVFFELIDGRVDEDLEVFALDVDIDL